jgi:hypothetical protein
MGKEAQQKGLCLVLFFLMTTARKHSLQEAAKFSGLNKSQFSRFLNKHRGSVLYTLDQLSKKEAKRLCKVLKYFAKNTLPWKIGLNSIMAKALS